MAEQKYIPRLKHEYDTEIMSKLGKDLDIDNKMSIPKVLKISINMGLGDAKENKNSLKQAVEELTNIAGQQAVITRSKKAISNFKLRIGDPVGIKVTLRGKRMYEFFDRLISIAIPRIRDFRGLPSKGFDKFGNYNFGITEQIVFPEIDYDKVNTIRGMNLTIVTSSKNSLEAHSLLREFGFPINEMIAPAEVAKAAAAKAEAEEEVAAAKKAAAEEVAAEETPIEETPEEKVDLDAEKNKDSVEKE